jgi:hypothetical protein
MMKMKMLVRSKYSSIVGLGGAVACCLLAILLSTHESSHLHLIRWTIAQWMPICSNRLSLQQAAWTHWEGKYRGSEKIYNQQAALQEEIPVVNVQEHLNDLTSYLEKTYGSDWRRRPLLLKNLWSPEILTNDKTRRLSLSGLLQENLTIPYFTDARKEAALSPDDSAPVRDIVVNISRGAPHKIGTQIMVQTYPELIYEVAPTEIVTELFGSYFTPKSVVGIGPFQLLPALTTVPMFVAKGKRPKSGATKDEERENDAQKRPFTALHCEPIGNVAVQLSGNKQWTLVRPEFSYRVRPSTSPDGRAFFASWQSSDGLAQNQVPSYTANTAAGDAIWVPTWTWHRVDYIESEDMAIGASLFHFRPLDFVRNNPIFAFLMVPAIILELVGYKTQ